MMSIHGASRAALAAAVRAPHASRCYPSTDHLCQGAPQLVGDFLSLRRATTAFRVGPSRDDVDADLEQSARPPPPPPPPPPLAAISSSPFSAAVRPLFLPFDSGFRSWLDLFFFNPSFRPASFFDIFVWDHDDEELSGDRRRVLMSRGVDVRVDHHAGKCERSACLC